MKIKKNKNPFNLQHMGPTASRPCRYSVLICSSNNALNTLSSVASKNDILKNIQINQSRSIITSSFSLQRRIHELVPSRIHNPSQFRIVLLTSLSSHLHFIRLLSLQLYRNGISVDFISYRNRHLRIPWRLLLHIRKVKIDALKRKRHVSCLSHRPNLRLW